MHCHQNFPQRRQKLTNMLRKVQSKYNPHYEAKKYKLSWENHLDKIKYTWMP
jgi:hypothetical protein